MCGASEMITTTCMECGAPTERQRVDQKFCSKAHKHAFHNRNIKRGNMLFPLVYRWRALRSSDPEASNAAFSRMCALLSNWIENDRRAGRVVPDISSKIGIASAVSYRPPTSEEAMRAADRAMHRDHAALKMRTGLR